METRQISRKMFTVKVKVSSSQSHAIISQIKLHYGLESGLSMGRYMQQSRSRDAYLLHGDAHSERGTLTEMRSPSGSLAAGELRPHCRKGLRKWLPQCDDVGHKHQEERRAVPHPVKPMPADACYPTTLAQIAHCHACAPLHMLVASRQHPTAASTPAAIPKCTRAGTYLQVIQACCYACTVCRSDRSGLLSLPPQRAAAGAWPPRHQYCGSPRAQRARRSDVAAEHARALQQLLAGEVIVRAALRGRLRGHGLQRLGRRDSRHSGRLCRSQRAAAPQHNVAAVGGRARAGQHRQRGNQHSTPVLEIRLLVHATYTMPDAVSMSCACRQ